MNQLLSSGLGLLGGLLLSIAWWYTITHRVVPKLIFSSHIGKLTTTAGEDAYRIKILNSGRRGAIDVSIHVRLVFDGANIYDSETPSTKQFLRMLTNNDHTFRIAPRKSLIIRLKPEETLGSALSEQHSTLYELFPEKAKSGNLSIEEVLAHQSASLEVRVLCYDEFSGARKYYESGRYSESNIAEGNFKDLGDVFD